jgi:hypothetical protein
VPWGKKPVGKAIRCAPCVCLDDWGLAVLSDENRRDMLELLEDRHGRRTTLVTTSCRLSIGMRPLATPRLLTTFSTVWCITPTRSPSKATPYANVWQRQKQAHSRPHSVPAGVWRPQGMLPPPLGDDKKESPGMLQPRQGVTALRRRSPVHPPQATPHPALLRAAQCAAAASPERPGAGVARPSGVWTCRAGEGKGKPHGCLGAKAAGRAASESSWGTESRGVVFSRDTPRLHARRPRGHAQWRGPGGCTAHRTGGLRLRQNRSWYRSQSYRIPCISNMLDRTSQ